MTTIQQQIKRGAGRPARSKESLFAEIQRHKSNLRDIEAENYYMARTLYKYDTAPLLSRIKYVIKKEI